MKMKRLMDDIFIGLGKNENALDVYLTVKLH